MRFSRRKLLGSATVTALHFCVAGCRAKHVQASRKVRLGLPAAIQHAKEFPLERVLVIRDPRGLRAISLLCTHQTCVLKQTTDGFQCPCHNSRFDMVGRVLEGPANKDLPHYELTVGEDGQLVADLGAEVSADWRLRESELKRQAT